MAALVAIQTMLKQQLDCYYPQDNKQKTTVPILWLVSLRFQRMALRVQRQKKREFC